MNHLKLFLIVFIVGLVIDYLWIGVIAKNFYLSQLGDLARIKDGKLDVVLPAAILVYILLVVGIQFLILPQLTDASWLKIFGYGALFGLICYGVYDLTNWATLKNWPHLYSLVDIAWGSVLCGMLTTFAAWTSKWLHSA